MNKKPILWTEIVLVLFMSSLVIAEFTGVAMAQSLVPLINEPLVPDTVKPGSTGFTLTVNGTGFVAGSVVHWNGSPLPTTFVSTSRLKASVPASNVAQPRTSSVTVVNPRPSTATSNVLFFGITAATSSVALSASSSCHLALRILLLVRPHVDGVLCFAAVVVFVAGISRAADLFALAKATEISSVR